MKKFNFFRNLNVFDVLFVGILLTVILSPMVAKANVFGGNYILIKMRYTVDSHNASWEYKTDYISVIQEVDCYDNLNDVKKNILIDKDSNNIINSVLYKCDLRSCKRLEWRIERNPDQFVEVIAEDKN